MSFQNDYIQWQKKFLKEFENQDISPREKYWYNGHTPVHTNHKDFRTRSMNAFQCLMSYG